MVVGLVITLLVLFFQELPEKVKQVDSPSSERVHQRQWCWAPDGALRQVSPTRFQMAIACSDNEAPRWGWKRHTGRRPMVSRGYREDAWPHGCALSEAYIVACDPDGEGWCVEYTQECPLRLEDGSSLVTDWALACVRNPAYCSVEGTGWNRPREPEHAKEKR